MDPLPLTPFSSSGFQSLGLAQAILSNVLGHEAEAIVVPVAGAGRPLNPLVAAGAPRQHQVATSAGAHFLVSDEPAIFSGLVTEKRLIVYSSADLARLSRASAPFYPPRLGRVLSSLDGRAHYVEWSAQWTGGAFVVTCTASDRCDVEVLTGFIT